MIQNKKSEFETKKRATFIDFINKMSHFMRFLSALILKIRNFDPELKKSDIFVQCGLGIRLLNYVKRKDTGEKTNAAPIVVFFLQLHKIVFFIKLIFFINKLYIILN